MSLCVPYCDHFWLEMSQQLSVLYEHTVWSLTLFSLFNECDSLILPSHSALPVSLKNSNYLMFQKLTSIGIVTPLWHRMNVTHIFVVFIPACHEQHFFIGATQCMLAAPMFIWDKVSTLFGTSLTHYNTSHSSSNGCWYCVCFRCYAIHYSKVVS